MPFTTAEKLSCVQREIRYREYVYERRVENRQMTREKADRELALMREIEADYRARLEGEEPRLFTDAKP